MIEKPVRLAVAGAGLIGKRHIASINLCEKVVLSAVVDPSEEGKAVAASHHVPWFSSLKKMFATDKPDGVIVATPNQVHVENGLECVAACCPMLIEKPLATTSDEAAILVTAARKAGVPLLVGHHRRHNPLIQKAKEVIDQGLLGEIRALQASCWLFKPDDYFETAPWRTQLGAGPISVNLVHDVDLIRYLCGDIIGIQAQIAASRRGHENEDVAAAVLTFDNGAVGTITVSDTIVSPWSWELTAQENPAYPVTDQSCYLIGGSKGSLSLPDLTLWHNLGPRSWWEPLSATALVRDAADPLINQVKQFRQVILGFEEPLVSGDEGLKTLRVIESIQRSALSGEPISLPRGV